MGAFRNGRRCAPGLGRRVSAARRPESSCRPGRPERPRPPAGSYNPLLTLRP